MSGVPFPKDPIYLSIEQNARFDLETPFERNDFYGGMFEGVLKTLETMEIDFLRLRFDSKELIAWPLDGNSMEEHSLSADNDAPTASPTAFSEKYSEEEPIVFTSYGSEYSYHEGSRSINDLFREEQNELIRVTLNPEGGMQDYVIQHDILKSEAQGLWIAILQIGLFLERRGLIEEFDDRLPHEIDLIVQKLDETPLGKRIREALAGYGSEDAQFDWNLLSTFGRDGFFDECKSLTDITRLIERSLGEADQDLPETKIIIRSDIDSSSLGQLDLIQGGVNRPGHSPLPTRRGSLSVMELVGFVLFGVIFPVRFGIAHASLSKLSLYLVLSSFALVVASWLWNPRMAFLRSGGWTNFPAFWALRFIHVTLVGGFLYGLARLST